jgi:hypothetical protein
LDFYEGEAMKTFSHSGTTGDTFCSLVIPKILGGGDFYLKLQNLETVVREKLGWPLTGRHVGRMTMEDYESMRELVLHQPYINSFTPWNGEHVDYELEDAALHLNMEERPRNFTNQYAKAIGLDLEYYKRPLQEVPWMECREPRRIPGRPIVIFRGPHYQEGNELKSKVWQDLIDRGLKNHAVYVGLEQDHQWFEDTFKVQVPHYRTPDYMELARVISGCELFISSMSSPSALGLALGKTMWLETRKNEPWERHEYNYPHRLNIRYF